MAPPVGASLLAMGLNEDASCRETSAAWTFIASLLAPADGQ
jgi:hypothetical protein